MTDLLACQKYVTETAPNAREDVEQRELSSPAGGGAGGAAASEVSLVVSDQAEQNLTTGSSDHTPASVPKAAANDVPTKSAPKYLQQLSS